MLAYPLSSHNITLKIKILTVLLSIWTFTVLVGIVIGVKWKIDGNGVLVDLFFGKEFWIVGVGVIFCLPVNFGIIVLVWYGFDKFYGIVAGLIIFSEVMDLVMMIRIGVPSAKFIQKISSLSWSHDLETLKNLKYFLKPDAAEHLTNGIESLLKFIEFSNSSSRPKRSTINLQIPDISGAVKPELIYPIVLFFIMVVLLFVIFIGAIHVLRIYLGVWLLKFLLEKKKKIQQDSRNSSIQYYKPPNEGTSVNTSFLVNSRPEFQQLYTQTLTHNFRPNVYKNPDLVAKV